MSNVVLHELSRNIRSPREFRTFRAARLLGGCLLALVTFVALVLAAPSASLAHEGHVHPGQAAAQGATEGRIPGVPDFQEIKGVTIRFDAKTREYVIKRPGIPAMRAHVESDVYDEQDGSQGPAASGVNQPLPSSESKPICATSGHRFVVVRAFPADTKTPNTEDAYIRSLVRRMTWKFMQQSKLSSGEKRVLRMKVDCFANGVITVTDIEVPFDHIGPGVDTTDGVIEPYDAMFYVENRLGTPEEEDAVKYLLFFDKDHPDFAGQGFGWPNEPVKSSENINRNATTTAIFDHNPEYGTNKIDSWETTLPIHESVHSMGAAMNSDITTAPYATKGFHCVDGIDILCYADNTKSPQGSYTESRCPKSEGYESPDGVPIDCKFDTYFDALTEPGEWLSEWWNVGGEENPFLGEQSGEESSGTSEPPVTGAAGGIVPTKATLNGSVDPDSRLTDYYFQYGLTSSYGASAPIPSASAGDGDDIVDVSYRITELKADTTYHYRLVTSNVLGTQYGKERTFKTAPAHHYYQSSFGTSGSGLLDGPRGIDVDAAGNIWVADSHHDRVVKFNSNGEYVSHFGSSGTGNGQLDRPLDVAVTDAGDVWVTDAENCRVQKFNSKGEFVTKFGSSGTEPGEFVEPSGIDIAPDGTIWVADTRYYRVQQFTANGGFIREVHGAGQGGSGSAEFLWPVGVEIDADGNVWVADSGNHRIQKLSPTGGYMNKFGQKGTWLQSEFEEPQAIAFKPSGALIVADRGSGYVQQFTTYVQQVTTEGLLDGRFGAGQLTESRGVATGPHGVTYVSRGSADRIEIWSQRLPSATTGSLTSLSPTSATLTGTVNPGGAETTYHFEYGETTAYGKSAPVPNQSVGSGTTDVAVTNVLSLEPETTYHYRLVATNANDTAFGQDQTFTTPSLTAVMPVTEPFDGSSSSNASFEANWSALGWASGPVPKGEIESPNGWRSQAAHPTLNGAYFEPVITDTGPGVGTMVTMGANPNAASGRHFSLWLDMQTPGGAKSGYELRFTHISPPPGKFDVTLSKWQGGNETVLASKSSYAFPNNSSLALVDRGETISVWTDTGSGLGRLLSVSDGAFSGGNAGLAASGPDTRLKKFKVGQLLKPVSSMSEALTVLPVRDALTTNENPLSGGGAWAALAWGNNKTGYVQGGGWSPISVYPDINGAYWQKASFADSGSGAAVSAKLVAKPWGTNRYFSLWLNAPSPATTRSGYELRFTMPTLFGNSHDVTISRWQAGTKSVLATKTGYVLPLESNFALVAKGGTISAWTRTGSEYTQILSAADVTFIDGYTGIEGSGTEIKLKDFRAGPLAPF